MKKQTPTKDIWNEAAEPEVETESSPEPQYQAVIANTVDDLKPTPTKIVYSLAGLKEDFPTAKELQQFVFDITQVSLQIKGIDPAKKYEIALAVLNGDDVDPIYISGANPYLDNNELIPEDPIKPIPARDPRLPNEEPMSIFHDMTVPHPDQNLRALDAKVKCMFKTYSDGSISYEIMGPLEKHSVGEKLDKYGRSRPEKFVWIDPRTGEQGIRYSDGSYSPMGKKLRTLMESKKVNRNASFWSVWIDRDFVQFNQGAIENPWA